MGARSADRAFAVGAPATREPLTRLSFLSRKFTPHKASLGTTGATAPKGTAIRAVPTTRAWLDWPEKKVGQPGCRRPSGTPSCPADHHERSPPSFGWLLHDLAARLLPLHLYRNNDRKTPAPSWFQFCGWRVRSHGGGLRQIGQKLLYRKQLLGSPDRSAGPATGGPAMPFARLA